MISGRKFEITAIRQSMLEVVARTLHTQEGYKDYREFVRDWEMLHPRKGFVPKQKVWVHYFTKVEEV